MNDENIIDLQGIPEMPLPPLEQAIKTLMQSARFAGCRVKITIYGPDDSKYSTTTKI